MPMRISYPWRVIATLIVGALLATLGFLQTLKQEDTWIGFADDTATAFLVTTAAAGGVGLGLEVIREGSRERSWGFGRWAWGLAALLSLLMFCRLVIERPWRKWDLGDAVFRGISRKAFDYLSHGIHTLSFYLAVFLLVALLARAPRAVQSDTRERSGRVFGGLVILWGVIYSLMPAMRTLLALGGR